MNNINFYLIGVGYVVCGYFEFGLFCVDILESI